MKVYAIVDKLTKGLAIQNGAILDLFTDKIEANNKICEINGFNQYCLLTLNIKEKQKNKNELEEEFQRLFWIPYQRKGNLKRTRAKWFNLSKKKQKLAAEYVPKYVKATPDKRFRKNGETFLYNECWNDELPETKEPVRTYSQPINKKVEEKLFKEVEELRNKNKGVSVRE